MPLKNGIIFLFYFLTETQPPNVHRSLNFARGLDMDCDIAEVMSPSHERVFDEMRDVMPAGDADVP
jgi:hypothetical protein